MSPEPPTVPVLRSLRTGTTISFPASSRYRPRADTVFHRKVLPALYSDPLDEYRASTEGVVLWDIGTEIPIEVSGPAALEFLDQAVTRDLPRCPVGECRYVFVTDQHGGIVNDPVVVRLQAQRFWLMPSESDLLLWLRALAAATEAEVVIQPVDTAPLQVRGPRAREVVRALAGDEVADLPDYRFARTRIDRFEVVTRTGFSGELGYELMPLDGSRTGPAFWETVRAAGRPFGIRVAAPSQIRRIEAGIFSSGVDMTLETDPFELTGYGWMVNLRKLPFVGRSTLVRIAREGPRFEVVGITIEGDPPPEFWGGLLVEPLPVFRPGDTEPTGRVTSACLSPALGWIIGFARLPATAAAPDTELVVQTSTGLRRARVVPTLFVDTEKRRVKS
ncbi:aminomethyltransferase family protein [Thermomicrobium sp. 4228-Ro]|uniref:aminomethyltransferase family protein n=1 Tax=Thermomicrobium sp. 4228-Ro TaxID=2993937 RepID=UPI0022491D7F|nr:aminomethyltransferase family protein [Thermomicrobium sp. 4228-Ro]MCX2727849.1 aminomethyltransferase family protein [Thermomicrobium sp. 4228-Ro]